jgi:hypothetical protein
MSWFAADGYWLGRLVLERGLALIYLLAFLVAVNQFRPLLGERGLLPAPRFLAIASFWEAPSLFHWRYSDALLLLVAWAGVALSLVMLSGLPMQGPEWLPIVLWFALWALYQSIVNIGQIFYGFGWESLLLEAGFLAMFLGSDAVATPWAAVLMFRWLLFRNEFGAGMIKMRGDKCWRDLTCLDYHHETQPMPNPLSRFFHLLPKRLHRLETLGNHVTQLVLPFGLFLPQPVATVCATVMILTQCWLVLSGNFSWLNLITIVIAFAAVDDSVLQHLLPVHHPGLADPPRWFIAWVSAGAVTVLVLSWWPARNLVSRRQHMNASFNPFHLVNTYGAFGSITRVRNEIVIEATEDPAAADESGWVAFEFKGKPGDPKRRPRQFAPYHLRLDWLMWFAAMSSVRQHPWVIDLIARLLEGDRPTQRLLRDVPFEGTPPAAIRARLYRYHFTTRAERRESGDIWRRKLIGEYLPPLRARGDGSIEVVP